MPPLRATSTLQLHPGERGSSSNASNLDLTVRGAASGDHLSANKKAISSITRRRNASRNSEEDDDDDEADAPMETRSEIGGGEQQIRSIESEFISTEKKHVHSSKNKPNRGVSAKTATSILPSMLNRSANRPLTEKSVLSKQFSSSNLLRHQAPPSESTIIIRPTPTMPNNIDTLGTDTTNGGGVLRKSGSTSVLPSMAGAVGGTNSKSPAPFDNYPLDSEHHAGMVITSLNAEIRKLRRRVEAHDDINLENRLLKDENKQLKNQVTRLKTMATSGDRTLTELEEKHFQLEEDLTQKNNLIQALTRQSRDVEQKIATREAEVHQVYEVNSQLQQLLDQKEQQLGGLSEQRQQHQQLISTLTQRLQQLEADLSERDQHIRTREDDHQTLLNDARRRHADDVDRMKASEEQEKRFHAAEIASMAETLRDRQKTIDGIESRLLIALQQIEELQDRIKQMNDDNQELRARASAAAVELGPKHRVTLLEERVAQLTRVNEDFKRKVPDLHYQIDKLQRKLDEAESRTQRKVYDLVQLQKTELLRKECKVKELEEELDTIRNAAMNLNSNNPNAISELITAMVASPAFGGGGAAGRNLSATFQRSMSRTRMRSMSPSTIRFGYDRQWSGHRTGGAAADSLRRSRRVGGSSNNLSGESRSARTPKPTAALKQPKGDNNGNLAADEQARLSKSGTSKAAGRRRRERSQDRRQD